jgi:alpha,alpha-trehalase
MRDESMRVCGVTLGSGCLDRFRGAWAASRDESYKEDMKTAATSNRPQAVVWRNLRAAAESGWDFSSRWLSDGRTLATMRTLDLLPPNLNSLLAQLERTLARAYSLKGDAEKSATYTARANLRTAAIQRLMWDAQDGVFTDYFWGQGRRRGRSPPRRSCPCSCRWRRPLRRRRSQIRSATGFSPRVAWPRA